MTVLKDYIVFKKVYLIRDACMITVDEISMVKLEDTELTIQAFVMDSDL
jgi:hypothetical protein